MSTKVATTRRSVILPQSLVREALDSMGETLSSFNSVVKLALQELIKARRKEAFAREMARMAQDPHVIRKNQSIELEFRGTLLDGLPDD